MVQPVAQEPAAHAGRAFIEQREEGRRGFAAQCLGELEIAARRGVEPDELAGALGADRSDMRERLALGARRVLKERATRPDRERHVFAAVARERGGAELL